jgi:tRNA pseudouridine55 synthase
MNQPIEGILLVDKPCGKTSFSLVGALRRKLGVKTIGHAGTLDPFATGVMVMLIGRNFTRLSNNFLGEDKEYLAQIKLGITTDSHDCDGQIIATSDFIPTQSQILMELEKFQGTISQVPPMFSAKKQQGKKLYELARKGKTVERPSQQITLKTEFINYDYPFINVKISCSKGTYVRVIAHDLGCFLGCGAHLSALQRIRSGRFHLANCLDGHLLFLPETDNNVIISKMIKKLES